MSFPWKPLSHLPGVFLAKMPFQAAPSVQWGFQQSAGHISYPTPTKWDCWNWSYHWFFRNLPKANFLLDHPHFIPWKNPTSQSPLPEKWLQGPKLGKWDSSRSMAPFLKWNRDTTQLWPSIPWRWLCDWPATGCYLHFAVVSEIPRDPWHFVHDFDPKGLQWKTQLTVFSTSKQELVKEDV